MAPYRLSISLLLLALFGSSGCVLGPPAYKTPFVESEYRPYESEGTSEVSGRISVDHADAADAPVAHTGVLLIPVTDYTREWYRATIVEQRYIELMDRRIRPFIRPTMTDADGRFEYRDLPAGQYYIAADTPQRGRDGRERMITPCLLVDLQEGESLRDVTVHAPLPPRR